MKRDEGHLNHLIFDLKLTIKKMLNIHNRATRKKKIKTYYKTHDKIRRILFYMVNQRLF